MPLDPTAASAWRESQTGIASDSAEKLRLARIALVESQRRKIDMENKVREKLLIDAGEVQSAHHATASKIRATLVSWVGSLPPRLAGLDETGIAKILHAEIYQALENLSSPQTYQS